MTEKLYLKDAYLKEADVKLMKSDGNSVVLSGTVFYPGGGGQPFDTGTLLIGGIAYNVIEMRKSGEDIVHVLDKSVNAEPGTDVHCAIDWQKRYAYMRYRTALHVIDGVITKNYRSDITATSSQIYFDKARLGFDMPELNRDLAAKIVAEADKFAKECHKVTAKEIPKEEALKIENLARTEPGKKLIESLDLVRIVEIEGVDMQADGGTHVANTSEIGSMSLLKFDNKGSHDKSIEIRLE